MIGFIVACSILWNDKPISAVGEIIQDKGFYDVVVDFSAFFKESGLDKTSQSGIISVNKNNCFIVKETK